MDTHAMLSEEECPVALWPWQEEVISTADYQRALESLKRFAQEVEINQLQTLEDLSAVASVVGHDLYVLAVKHGKKMEKKTQRLEPSVSEPISRVERHYVFTHALAHREIVVTASKESSLISLSRLCGFQRYPSEELSISLPTDRDIAIGVLPNVDEQSLYARDFRGARRAYHPAKEPGNSHIQQGFAHLLKEALSALGEVVAPLG